MVRKCANPTCSATFHYLRDGRLFQLEVAPRIKGPTLVQRGRPDHRIEHFWLCGPCSQTMTLIVEDGKGVVTVPTKSPQYRAAAAS